MILLGISHPPEKKLKGTYLFRFSKDTLLVDWQLAMEHIHVSW